LNGLTRRTGIPAASKARTTPRSYPPLASMPIAAIEESLSRSTRSAQPPASLFTEEHRSSGKIMTSKRSFDTSIPPNESIAIFVSLSC
jgi:hypothetical protein